MCDLRDELIFGHSASIRMKIEVNTKKNSPTFDAVGGLCTATNGVGTFSGVMALASSSLFTQFGSAVFNATILPQSALGSHTGANITSTLNEICASLF
jgi:hypothetical protein